VVFLRWNFNFKKNKRDMTDKQVRKANEYGAVLKVLNSDGYKSIWIGLEEFAGFVLSFETLCERIMAEGTEQVMDRTGTAAEKREARKALVAAMMNVIYGVIAYAVIREDAVIEKKIAFSQWSLQKCRDSVLVARAQLVYETAFPLRNELTRYRVSEEDIGLVDTLKGTFRDLVPQPRDEQIRKKMATRELKDLFKRADDLLYNKIDRVIKVYERDFPGFVQAYFIARIIVDIGVRHMEVKPGVVQGFVMIEGSTIPLRNVRVQMEGRKRVVKTDGKGWFKFWFKKEAKVVPVFELDGYVKDTGTETVIKLGEMVEMRVFLVVSTE
jgi:hypothetical protein